MNCKDCPLNDCVKICGEGFIEVDNRVVVSDEKQFDVVVVGMYPGEEEDRRGHVFIGASGQFVRKQLHQLGISRYYMCNVLLCDAEGYEDDVIKKATECCKDRLISEIRSVKPKLVIALGDLPLHLLCRTDYSIKEIEGRVIPSSFDSALPVLPIAHPAFYLRKPEDAFDFIECMRSGIKILDGSYRQASEVTHTLVTTDNISQILEEINRHEYISVDSETTGYFAHGMHPDEILELGIATDSHHAYIIPNNLIVQFKNILETKKGLYWVARFDCSFLKKLGITPNVYFDGMLAHYCLDERSHSHGLKRCSRIYLGSEDWEADIDKYLPNKKTSSYALIPEDVRHVYLSKDACRTYQMWEVLRDSVKDNWVFWNVIMPATRMFIETEFFGLRIDPYKVEGLYLWLGEEVEKAEKELWELAETSFNPSSPKEVAEILYDKLRIPMDPRFGRSTNKHLLEAYRDEYEIVNKIIEYREMCHDRDTYIEGFVKRMDNNFRVHPAMKLFGTVTGRISSENPSIMNIKANSRIKELFLPEDGHLIANFDFKQMELRWYCIYSGDQVLTEILTDGRDPHTEIGIVAYGNEKEAKEKRIIVKSFVFGRLYGRGKRSFLEGGQRYRRGQFEAGVSEDDVDYLVGVIDDMVPGLKSYARERKQEVRNRGYVESYFGRQRRFPLITSQNSSEVERQAINMPIQSAGSDLNLLCMLHLWNLRDKYNIRPLFCVHDSIVIDVPNVETVSILKDIIEKKAYEIVEGKIPFPVDADWGYDWSLQKTRR